MLQEAKTARCGEGVRRRSSGCEPLATRWSVGISAKQAVRAYMGGRLVCEFSLRRMSFRGFCTALIWSSAPLFGQIQVLTGGQRAECLFRAVLGDAPLFDIVSSATHIQAPPRFDVEAAITLLRSAKTEAPSAGKGKSVSAGGAHVSAGDADAGTKLLELLAFVP